MSTAGDAVALAVDCRYSSGQCEKPLRNLSNKASVVLGGVQAPVLAGVGRHATAGFVVFHRAGPRAWRPLRGEPRRMKDDEASADCESARKSLRQRDKYHAL